MAARRHSLSPESGPMRMSLKNFNALYDSAPLLRIILILLILLTLKFGEGIRSVRALPIQTQVDSIRTTLQRRITHTGRGTWFYPGDGNCGQWNTSSQFVLAISIEIYNNGDNCGQWVHVTNTDTNDSVYAQMVDSCQGCDAGSVVCRDFIQALEQCHAEWWGARFFGLCNTAKRELNICLRNERINRAAKNREISKERRERAKAAWRQLEVEEEV